jgi:hypothetical protein
MDHCYSTFNFDFETISLLTMYSIAPGSLCTVVIVVVEIGNTCKKRTWGHLDICDFANGAYFVKKCRTKCVLFKLQ